MSINKTRVKYPIDHCFLECIYKSIQSKDVCSEAIEEKSAVDFPFLAMIKVFTNNSFNLKSVHFYRQFKRGIQVSRSIEKGRRCKTRPNFEAIIFNRKNSGRNINTIYRSQDMPYYSIYYYDNPVLYT